MNTRLCSFLWHLWKISQTFSGKEEPLQELYHSHPEQRYVVGPIRFPGRDDKQSLFH